VHGKRSVQTGNGKKAKRAKKASRHADSDSEDDDGQPDGKAGEAICELDDDTDDDVFDRFQSFTVSVDDPIQQLVQRGVTAVPMQLASSPGHDGGAGGGDAAGSAIDLDFVEDLD